MAQVLDGSAHAAIDRYSPLNFRGVSATVQALTQTESLSHIPTDPTWVENTAQMTPIQVVAFRKNICMGKLPRRLTKPIFERVLRRLRI